MTTIGGALAEAERRLRAAGVEAPRRDARLLLAELLGGEGSATVMAWPERELAPDLAEAFSARIERRAAREPVARILGRREFWSLPLRLVPETLDPRPDSEALVEGLLRGVADRTAPLRLLDLGTGSGCLLLALLSELPGARGLGIDRSEPALEAARANASALGLAERAEFRAGDWCEGLEARFDLLVCNPPYIPGAEIAALEPEVACWEPRAALDGGADGLDPYRRVLPRLETLLAPGGRAAFEHGPGQGEAIAALLPAPERWRLETLCDLSGRARGLLFVRATP